MITVNKFVVLHYNLKEDNSEGQLIESTYSSNPLEFVFGSGKMIPMFEDMIEGKLAGDRFAFSIPSEQAYGAINLAAVMDLDTSVFEYHGKVDYEMVRVGNVIPMRDSNGQRIDGKVLEVDSSKVKIDFNHPLAGKNLYFEGEILSVEDYEEHEHHHHHHHDTGGCGCGSGCGCH